MAVVELQYLYEIRRIIVPPQEILVKLNAEIGLTVCDHPFPIIAEVALGETWTRDPSTGPSLPTPRRTGLRLC
jgi:hypothetical protein